MSWIPSCMTGVERTRKVGASARITDLLADMEAILPISPLSIESFTMA